MENSDQVETIRRLEQEVTIGRLRREAVTRRLQSIFNIVFFILKIVLLVAAVIVVIWLIDLFFDRLPEESDLDRVVLFFLVGLALIGIYPITYIAHQRTVDDVQQKRLVEDFGLLGLPVPESEPDLNTYVHNLYQTTFNPRQYWAFIGLIMLAAVLLLVAFLNRQTIAVATMIEASTITLVFYSFLGAYTFSVQELVRRYNTNDLRPQVYSSILVRILVAAMITFVAATVIDVTARQIVVNVNPAAATVADTPTAEGAAVLATPEATATATPEEPAAAGEPAEGLSATIEPDPARPEAWAAVLAFVIGFFPSRGTRWLTDRTSAVLSDEAALVPELPLRNIAGISTWHEARLLEMGIDDAHNLATVDLSKMLLTTRFDTQEIVSWIDQAILYAKVRKNFSIFRDKGITSFHEYRVRTSQVQARSADAREAMRTSLSLATKEDIAALADPGNFPNAAYIAEYYLNAPLIATHRAAVGVQRLREAEGAGEFRGRITVLQDRTVLYPEDARAWANLGAARFATGQFEEALEDLSTALALNPNLAQCRSSRAGAFLELNRLEEALADCDLALMIEPLNKFTRNYRGLAHLLQAENSPNSQELLNQAVADFSRALELDDLRFAEAYLNRGTAYNKQKQYNAAVEDFKLAYLLLDRSNTKVWSRLWLNWGTALNGRGSYEEAIAKLTPALSLALAGAQSVTAQPAVAAATIAQTLTERGYAYLKLNDPAYNDRAGSDLREALRLLANRWKSKTALDARDFLVELEMRLGQQNIALELYRELLQVDPDHHQTRVKLADLYEHTDDLEQSYVHYTTVKAHATSGSPEFLDAEKGVERLYRTRYNRGVEYENDHMIANACADYQWVIDKAPDTFSWKGDARQRFQAICGQEPAANAGAAAPAINEEGEDGN